MSFNIKGYNTDEEQKKTNSTRNDELIELDVFEKCVEKKEDSASKNSELEAIRKQNEQIKKELKEYEELQKKLAEAQQKFTKENYVEKNEATEKLHTETSVEQKEASSQVIREATEQQDPYKEAKETASDIIESTLDVFEGLGSSIQQFSSTTSKLKQAAHNAWSLKQDKEIKRKFKNSPKVNVGDYTFKVHLETKELMLYSYQGPDTILKLPSSVKDMPITAINSDFLLFRAPKALFNTVKGETIGKDLDSIKQCMTCVEQLRLPEHLVYLPSGLFENCSTLDVVVIPKAVIGVSSMFLDGSNVRRVVFEGKCPSGLKHANIPAFTKISCKKDYIDSYAGIVNLSVL